MLVLKFFHVLFVFIWIGSLLALTRLIAYQAREEKSVQLALARIYLRMYLFVDLPSMILAIALGLILSFVKQIDFLAGWFHMKMTFTFFLIVCDLITGRSLFKLQGNPITGKGIGYKILHGVTALMLIGVLVAIYIVKAKA